jgi:hypothetical protein
MYIFITITISNNGDAIETDTIPNPSPNTFKWSRHKEEMVSVLLFTISLTRSNGQWPMGIEYLHHQRHMAVIFAHLHVTTSKNIV